MGLEQPLVRAFPFYPGQLGIPGSDNELGLRTVPQGVVYYVNSTAATANDDNDGTDPVHPLATIEEAYSRCTSGHNDVVAVIGQAVHYPLAASLTWAKNYTHMIGITADLPGLGQRARVVAPNTIDAAAVMTVNADGCLFKNLQFYNGNDAAADSGAVVVAGSRNYFDNCQISGMADAVPGARAACFSLKINGGSENTFNRCSIGLQTIIRAAANAELVLDGNCYRNKFVDCEFLSWSVTAGKFLVSFAATAVSWTTQFENCLFDNLNMTAGGAAGAAINNAFNDGDLSVHQIILRGKNQFVGCTGVADTLTNIWSAEPVPNTGFGISVNPAA